MNPFRLAACALRPVTRALRHKLMTPVLFTVTVTLLFLLVSTPSLIHRHAHKPGSSGGSRRLIESARKGLLPVNLPRPPRAQERMGDGSGDYSGGSNHSSSERFFLTVLPRGRLGNQMFQYASLLGLAAQNNRTAFVTSSCKVTHYFAGARVSDRPVSSWPAVEEDGYARRDPQLDSLPRENVKIRGFLQSWRYFRHVEDEVRAAFRFLPDVQRAADLFYVNQTRDVIGSDVIKVGVHVRRTDMAQRTEQRQGYLPAPLSYLLRAMDHMRTLYGRRVVFFVISDDPEWCRAHLLPRGTRPGHASDQRASDQRASDQRASDQRASDQRASDQRASDQRASDHGASDQRASDQHAADQRASDQRPSDQRASDQRATDQRASDQRASDQRAAEQRASDESASDQHASDQRASDQRATDQRASDQRASDQRASDQRASDRRASDQLASDQRATDQRASDQSASGQYSTRYPVSGRHVSSQHVHNASGYHGSGRQALLDHHVLPRHVSARHENSVSDQGVQNASGRVEHNVGEMPDLTRTPQQTVGSGHPYRPPEVMRTPQHIVGSGNSNRTSDVTLTRRHGAVRLERTGETVIRIEDGLAEVKVSGPLRVEAHPDRVKDSFKGVKGVSVRIVKNSPLRYKNSQPGFINPPRVQRSVRNARNNRGSAKETTPSVNLSQPNVKNNLHSAANSSTRVKTIPAAFNNSRGTVIESQMSVKNSSTSVENSQVSVKNSSTSVNNNPESVKNNLVLGGNSSTYIQNNLENVKKELENVKNNPTSVQSSPVRVKAGPVSVRNDSRNDKTSPVTITNSRVSVKNSLASVKNSPDTVTLPVTIKSVINNDVGSVKNGPSKVVKSAVTAKSAINNDVRSVKNSHGKVTNNRTTLDAADFPPPPPPPQNHQTDPHHYPQKQHTNPSHFSAQTQTDPPPFSIGSSHQHHVIVVGPAPSVVHLGFLARCDHVIMTVGTFGWWGAYLSAGHVTYYSGYPRAGSEVAEGFSHSDFYPPSWVALGD